MRIKELLAEKKNPSNPPKPRNPVAKNATAAIGGGAAGAHKDKKKAAKQGQVKHKGRIEESTNLSEEEYDYYRDYKAGLISYDEYQRLVKQFQDREKQQRYSQASNDKGPWYLKIEGKIYKQKGAPKVFDWKRGANNYALAILKNRPELEGKIFLTKKNQDDPPPQANEPTATKESATAGSTSSSSMSVGAVYPNKKGKTYKNKDGTVKNALDVAGGNLMTGGSLVRR